MSRLAAEPKHSAGQIRQQKETHRLGALLHKIAVEFFDTFRCTIGGLQASFCLHPSDVITTTPTGQARRVYLEGLAGGD